MARGRDIVACFDLDDTLADATVFDFIYSKYYFTKEAESMSISELLAYGFNREFSSRRDDLIQDLIMDTEDFLLARTMKKLMADGHKVAIVTFNTSLEYTNFALALMGLSEEEINRIVVVHRDDEVPENKNGYIKQVLDEHGFNFTDEQLRDPENKDVPIITLLDDNVVNCEEANKEIGVDAFHVYGNKEEYIEDFYDMLGYKIEELLAIDTPSFENRFALAFKMMPVPSVENVVARPLAVSLIAQQGLAEIAVALNEVLPPIDASDVNRLKRSFEMAGVGAHISGAHSTALASSLHCDEVLDVDIEQPSKRSRDILFNKENVALSL